ncbi:MULTISPECIES: hypothetical protein [Delftia]|uniref:hypothetical protein n=1 Tax=Delftia TaxID=80865 RepID=UPI0009271EBF|nr:MULTISPECIES: hypothetical protein [Delftia]OJX11309.1 MAG: hypothetical protein BGO79_17595 [Delftia sp. 67-8]QFS64504.1 hypothetical protein GCS91_09335 [Delftia tsuruhatensis]
MLRLQLVSDLHLEQNGLQAPFTVRPGVDLVVLAGSVAGCMLGMEFARALKVSVLYVPGIREHAGLEVDQTTMVMKFEAIGSKVKVLQNDSVVIGGVRFLGTTLWPDFGSPVHLGRLALAMSPYEDIRHKGKPIPYAALLWHHNCAVAWLAKRLAQPFKGPTVVVSHHAPHPKSTPLQGPIDPIAQPNQSRLTELMQSAAIWLHGGVSVACDYRIGATRVAANPFGSPTDRGYPYSIVPGSNGYDPELVIDVMAP